MEKTKFPETSYRIVGTYEEKRDKLLKKVWSRSQYLQTDNPETVEAVAKTLRKTAVSYPLFDSTRWRFANIINKPGHCDSGTQADIVTAVSDGTQTTEILKNDFGQNVVASMLHTEFELKFGLLHSSQIQAFTGVTKKQFNFLAEVLLSDEEMFRFSRHAKTMLGQFLVQLKGNLSDAAAAALFGFHEKFCDIRFNHVATVFSRILPRADEQWFADISRDLENTTIDVNRCEIWSHGGTLSFIVATSDCGHIIFVSKTFRGEITDDELISQSGISLLAMTCHVKTVWCEKQLTGKAKSMRKFAMAKYVKAGQLKHIDVLLHIVAFIVNMDSCDEKFFVKIPVNDDRRSGKIKGLKLRGSTKKKVRRWMTLGKRTNQH